MRSGDDRRQFTLHALHRLELSLIEKLNRDRLGRTQQNPLCSRFDDKEVVPLEVLLLADGGGECKRAPSVDFDGLRHANTSAELLKFSHVRELDSSMFTILREEKNLPKRVGLGQPDFAEEGKKSMVWVYIQGNAGGGHYIGPTDDFERRLANYNEAEGKSHLG